MENTHVIFGMIAVSLVMLSGCCGTTGSASSCTLGTYGEACTYFCERARGTEFDGGPTCFSDCTDLVRQQGFGDATTCCRESVRRMCQRTCSDMADNFISQYGDVMEPGEAAEVEEECWYECTGAYDIMGIPLDSCSVIDTAKVIDIVESG